MRVFGKIEGRDILAVDIKNAAGISATVITKGAILQSLTVPDKNGEAGQVVLGYNTIEEYLETDGHFGEVVGRCCNRIGNSRFTLDGKEYILDANDGANHLHGGTGGFGARIWDIEYSDDTSVTLTLKSEDGDMGYPGNMQVWCTYTLTDDGKLTLTYKATCDKTCPVCLTNHTYFDLCGVGSGKTLDMELYLNSHKICSTDKKLIPDGQILDIAGTAYDFSTGKAISRDIKEDYLLLPTCNGYDTNYFLEDFDGTLRHCATLSDTASGRTMKVYTDLPCIQFYCGNMIGDKNPPFFGIAPSRDHMGICLETQVMPNAANFNHITPTMLHPEEIWESTTVFEFGV